MATFRSIKELTRALQQGSKLLSNMFLQRKTIAVKYDDALDTLDGDENKLKHRHYRFCPWIAHAKLLAKYHRATVQEERQVTYTPKFGSEAFHL